MKKTFLAMYIEENYDSSDAKFSKLNSSFSSSCIIIQDFTMFRCKLVKEHPVKIRL